MSTDNKPVAATAQLRRVCCDYKTGVPSGSTNRAHWELYVVLYNTTDAWPAHQWPVSRRHQPPTVTERADALEKLGYTPAPEAEWTWQETETPTYHGHPWAVSFFGTIDIVPLEKPAVAEDGDS